MIPSNPALRFLALVLLGLMGPFPAFAAWPTNPSANLPIAMGPSSYPERPVVVADGAGGAMILWAQTADRHDLRAQRVSSEATLLWPKEGVPVCVTAGHPQGIVSLADGTGGCFLAWEDSTDDGGVYAQHIALDGATWPIAGGAGLPVCTAAHRQMAPWMATDGAGGVILTWMDRRTGLGNVYAQRLRSVGVAAWPTNGVPVCTADDAQDDPTIAEDGSGGAILAWADARFHTDYDLYAQRVDSTGAPLWTLDGVQEAPTFGNQGVPRALSDGAGGALVIWHEDNLGEIELRAQRLSPAGSALWLAGGVPVFVQPGDQVLRGALPDGAGGAFVLYEQDADARDPGPLKPVDFFVQRLTTDGPLGWPAPGVRLTDSDGLFDRFGPPAMASDGAGGVIVCWSESRAGAPLDVYAQRISSAGARLWGNEGVLVCGAGGDQDHSALASDGAGGAILAWEDFRYDPSGDIFAQRVLADGTLGHAPEPPPTPSFAPNALTVFPNPARSAALVHFVVPDAAVRSIAIHDMSGRLFARLLLDHVFNGEATAVPWTIEDELGRAPRPGIYFARAEAAGRRWTARFAIMP